MTKKKTKKISLALPPQLQETLNQALTALPPGTEWAEEDLTAFSDYLRQFNGHEQGLIEALVKIGTNQALNFLWRLSQSVHDKALAKTARRAIYRLEQTGQKTEKPLRSRGVPLIQAVPKRQPQGYSTCYDPSGARMCILVLPGPYSGYEAALFVVDHQHGLKDFNAFSVTGGELNRMLKDFGRADPQGLVEIPAGGARLALIEAADQARGLGVKLPDIFEAFKAKIHVVPGPARPLIHDLVEADSLSERFDMDLSASELLSHWLFKGFVLGYELRPYFERIKEVDSGIIILTEAQKRNRRLVILVKFQEEQYGPERKARLIRQIEETALMLWQIDEKRLAAAALAQVLDLGQEPSQNRPHAFILGMIENTLKLMARTLSGETRPKEPPATGSGLILP